MDAPCRVYPEVGEAQARRKGEHRAAAVRLNRRVAAQHRRGSRRQQQAVGDEVVCEEHELLHHAVRVADGVRACGAYRERDIYKGRERVRPVGWGTSRGCGDNE
jgi:hypothetical protein